MNLKTLYLIIGLLGVLSTCCETKKTKTLEESEFITDSIFSKNLSEYRQHNVYLPKGYSKEKKYPIIYATDGNSEITNIKKTLDSLIENNIIKPLIFVASFSNLKIADSTSTTTADGKKIYLNFRNFEYVDHKPNREEDSLLIDLFENHKAYFAKELINHIEKKYNQNNGKEYRYFYGVSNGAGFGLSLLNDQPGLIGTYLCFSTFGGDTKTNIWKKDVKYPNLYLKYGTEEFFLKGDADFLKLKYAESNSFIEIKEFKGSHNNRYWKEEFIETISQILN